MKLCFFVFLIHLFTHGNCNSDIRIGYKFTIPVPTEYSMGFIGRAFVIESNQMVPNFKVALSVEPGEQKYSCSLDVFLGDVKVWSSGHFSRFYTTEKCVLELTQSGDLQLKGREDSLGWKAGTSGQDSQETKTLEDNTKVLQDYVVQFLNNWGNFADTEPILVQRLNLLRTGNLVLVDALDGIKWQSFNFPTNIMLWGQRLNVRTHLTSFPNNSSSFFSFEIQHDKLALYLNFNKLNYTYWEFKPLDNQNITFIKVSNNGLDIFGDEYTKIARVPSGGFEPLRFMALGNETGNLGFYYYSNEKGKFEASFLAINNTCDLPLACKPYGICTLSDVCSCIRFITRDGMNSNCSNGTSSGGYCRKNKVEMIELSGVTTVLKGTHVDNVGKEKCSDLCLDDCNCTAALYSFDLGECFLYDLVRGVKQVPRGNGSSYMVKVPKGSGGDEGKSSGLRKWVLVVVGVADGLILVLVLGGLGYYVIQKRRKNLQRTHNTS